MAKMTEQAQKFVSRKISQLQREGVPKRQSEIFLLTNF